jgi:hypothetical protein
METPDSNLDDCPVYSLGVRLANPPKDNGESPNADTPTDSPETESEDGAESEDEAPSNVIPLPLPKNPKDGSGDSRTFEQVSANVRRLIKIGENLIKTTSEDIAWNEKNRDN